MKEKLVMGSRSHSVLYRTLRVLGIIFSIFLSLFALDVFDEGLGFWETILALVVHLIPTFVLIISLIIAWRWELTGGILYIGYGLFYVFWAWGSFPVTTFVAVSGPLSIVGAIFILEWMSQTKRRMG